MIIKVKELSLVLEINHQKYLSTSIKQMAGKAGPIYLEIPQEASSKGAWITIAIIIGIGLLLLIVWLLAAGKANAKPTPTPAPNPTPTPPAPTPAPNPTPSNTLVPGNYTIRYQDRYLGFASGTGGVSVPGSPTVSLVPNVTPWTLTNTGALLTTYNGNTVYLNASGSQLVASPNQQTKWSSSFNADGYAIQVAAGSVTVPQCLNVVGNNVSVASCSTAGRFNIIPYRSIE
jgi:hypothetical protein